MKLLPAVVALSLLVGCSDSDLNHGGDIERMVQLSQRLRDDGRCTHDADPPINGTHFCGQPVSHAYHVTWEDLVIRTGEKRQHNQTTYWCEGHHDPEWVSTQREFFRSRYAELPAQEMRLLTVKGSVDTIR